MRFLFWSMLLVVGGLAALYFLGGYSTLDPSKQGRDAKAAITVGMPFHQVLDIAGIPHNYQQINRHVRKVRGEELVEFEPGPAVPFDRVRVEQRLETNDLPYGFRLPYRCSESVAFYVEFDESGAVVEVGDMLTKADLFGTNK